MRLITTLVFVLMAFTMANAQEETGNCPFNDTQKEYYDTHPEAKDELNAFEEKVLERKTLLKSGTYNKAAKKYTIPVVFHIYGNQWPLTGGENVDVTEDKVIQAMNAINADFAGFNDAVDPAFQNIEGGMDIEFKLAQIDPDGNTTNGIVWHETKEGFGLNGTNDSEIAKYAWDNFKYMNVHIQLVINAGSTTSSGIAWFPSTGMSEEGTARVVYNGRYMIYNPPASSLTHEFGHWLGLHHTFNGGCVSGDENGDKVADTPPTLAGTASQTGGESCATGVTNCFNQLINHQNHMDYNPCESMFTQGQVVRMETFLDHDARKTLWTDANLIETGVMQDLGARVLFSYQDKDDSEIDKSLGFLEDFNNNGGIQNAKRLKAIDGAQFAVTGNLQQGTHFTATGVPSGLIPVVNVVDNYNAVVSFTGNAFNNEESDSATITITLLNPSMVGGVASLHSTSGTFKMNFLDGYEVHYETYSPFMSMGYSGSNVVSDVNSKFNSLVIGGSFRTRLKVYDGNILAIDNFAQGFEVLCNSNTINAKYFSEGSNLNANSSGTWVQKATLSIDSPPVLSSPDYTAWRNKTGYVAIRVPTPTNSYVYGWLRARVSFNGEEGDIMNLALNPDPGQGLVASIERPHLTYSSDRFLEKIKNDNTIENEITVDLESATFVKTGNLERGVHYTVNNVPAGLIMKVNAISSTQVKLRLDGVFQAPNVSGSSDWLAARNIKFEFLDGAFSSGAGANVELKDFNFSLEKVGQSYTGTNISHPVYNLGQTYSSPPGQFMLITPGNQVANAGATYQFQNYPSSNSGNEFPGLKLITWRRDAVANNNYELTPLSQGVIIGPNSSWKNGREFHNGRGQHMIDSDSYTAWRGKTAYYGVRIRRSGRMHYGWARMRVSSNGTQFEIEEYGINGTPNASIRAGELFSDDVQDYCAAGSTYGPDNIKRVTFANIDRSTGTRPDGGYDNQTDHYVKLVRGESYNLKVEITGNSTNEVYAWFDWNQDKDFNDPNERVQITIANGTTIGEVSVVVPTNATLGGSRLRLRISRSNNNNPCGSSGTGEVEDYGIFVSNEEIPTCEDGIKNGDETKIDCGGSCEPCEVFAEICEASTTSPTLQINKVEFGSINNTSAHNPYNDFTSQSTNLEKGQATQLTITLNNQWSPNQVMVWIDWYDDNDFLNTEDVVLKKSGAIAYTGSVTPPDDAVVNTGLRMRVRAGYTFEPDPCGVDTGIGEVEDYTVTVGGSIPTDTQAPTAPNNLVASNIAETTLTLNWTTATDNVGVTGYDVYRASTKLATISGTTYGVTGLTGNTTYTFSVRAKDAAGNVSASSNVVNATTTGDTPPPPTYCTASGNNGIEAISNVTFAGINNSSVRNASGYEDFTSEVANVSAGTNHNLKVTIIGYNDGSANEIYAWFDWSNDGDFTDAGEYVLLNKTNGTIGESTINIPQNAASGVIRMRVRVAYNAASNVPCGAVSYGEVEDYGVNIGGITIPNEAPTVNITSPADGATFNAGNSIAITASASDTDGAISKVEFFNGGTKLGEDSTSPYSYNWNNVTSGSYTLTAKATDNEGAATTSTNVKITVNATPPPTSYCSATGNGGPEGISNVIFAGINNSSVRNATGYDDFTSVSGSVNTGASHNLNVTIIGYDGGSTDEIYAWFDWNIDGDFTDAGESYALTKTSNLEGNVSVSVPQSATNGATRMRILVSYYDVENNPCDTGTNDVRYGEYEDYTINVNNASAKIDMETKVVDEQTTTLRNAISAYPNPVTDGKLNIDFNSSEKGEAHIEIYDVTGTKVYDKRRQKGSEQMMIVDFNRKLPAGFYLLKVSLGEEGTGNIIKIIVE